MHKVIHLNRNLTKIVLVGLVLRLVVLVLILTFSNFLPSGFYGEGESVSTYDDNRYLAGAKYYSDNAKSIIDIPTFSYAFSRLGDNVGKNMLEKSDNPLAASTPLWYWIICVLYYLTKTEITIRLLNIILSLLSVIYLYKLANILVEEKVAIVSSWLLSALPYPVVFSCFAYKDQFIMFIYTFCLYWASVYRRDRTLSKSTIFLVILLIIALVEMRGGLSIIFIAILIAAFFYQPSYERKNVIQMILFFSGSVFVIVLLIQFQDVIFAKLNYYVNHRQSYETSTLATYLSINGFKDIFKLPFLYFASLLMPIGINKPINTWYKIVSLFGFALSPLAVGNTFYLFAKQKYDWLFYYLTLGFYIVSIIASIGNPRHYYSLLQFSLLAFSDYYCSISSKDKRVLFLISMPISLLLVSYFLFRY